MGLLSACTRPPGWPEQRGAGVRVGASQGCGKGRQAAAVTNINAMLADVSNGFAFTPLLILSHTQLCVQQVCFCPWIHTHTHTHSTTEWWLIFQVGQSKCVNFEMCELSVAFACVSLSALLSIKLYYFCAYRAWPFLFCDVFSLFWRAAVSFCVYPQHYNLYDTCKQKKDLIFSNGSSPSRPEEINI